MRSLVLLSAAASAAATVYNVLDYGAQGDGNTFDTAAIKAAFAAAGSARGGKVVFPAGYTFLTGSFNVTANTIISVEGTILASPNATGYVLQDPLPWFGPDPTR
jgi:polygalacturonase